jgi:aspartate aminotransferase
MNAAVDRRNSPWIYLNLKVWGLGQSATLAINERSRELASQGRTVYRLGLGQSPFPVPDSVAQALRDHAHEKDYLAVKGLPALREAIVGYLQRTEGLEFDPANVLVGPGTKELMFILQMTYYGDLVIPTPSWVSYAPQAQILGRPLQWLPTAPETGLGVTPEALDALCRTEPERPRLLILNSPGNPTGKVYTRDQLEGIAEVARRYRVLLLSDEIYSGTQFDGAHESIARYYPEGTIISNGLSKWCGAGGWRIGAFVFPEGLSKLLRGMAAVASETFTSTSAPVQYAAVRGFQGGPDIDAYLSRSRRILQALSEFAYARLVAAGAEVSQPAGGFYIFPNFEARRERLLERGVVDSTVLCEQLLEDTGVACLPGSVFGRPPTEYSMRLAYVDFDGGPALEALGDLPCDALPGEDFLRTCCPRTVAGFERLAEWMGR